MPTRERTSRTGKAGVIANAYGAVCVEDLDLRAMAQSMNLGKSTNDNGFGMFREYLKYKLEEQGKHLIKVDKNFQQCRTSRIKENSSQNIAGI